MHEMYGMYTTPGTGRFQQFKYDDPATPKGMPNMGGKMRGTQKMKMKTNTENKVSPGLKAGQGGAKHNTPGALPSSKTGGGSNKMPADLGCWNSASGSKDRP